MPVTRKQDKRGEDSPGARNNWLFSIAQDLPKLCCGHRQDKLIVWVLSNIMLLKVILNVCSKEDSLRVFLVILVIRSLVRSFIRSSFRFVLRGYFGSQQFPSWLLSSTTFYLPNVLSYSLVVSSGYPFGFSLKITSVTSLHFNLWPGFLIATTLDQFSMSRLPQSLSPINNRPTPPQSILFFIFFISILFIFF